MKRPVEVSVLISQAEIASRVAQLGQQISEDFADRPLTLIGVMTGCLYFLTDLSRQITVPHQIGILQASSYQGTRTEPGQLRTSVDYLPDLSGRDLLVIDDIFDTGQTLTGIYEQLNRFKPASLQSAILLSKPERHQVSLQPDYIGFTIANRFVVGYGLDFNDAYRELPDICVIEP